MCKFENEGSPGFDLIVDGIQRYAEEAPSVTRQRWLAEKQERLNQKLRKAKELVPGAISMFELESYPTSFSSSSLTLTRLGDIKLSDNGFVDPPSSTTSPSKLMPQMNKLAFPSPTTPPFFDVEDGGIPSVVGREAEEVE